jgi:phage gp45-like
MTNYVQSTNFATKDALPSGDPLKIVKGTEINTEFVNIAVAVATKADLASPTFTGNVTGTFVGNVTGNVTGSSSSLATTNWTVLESGGYLYFRYGGVNKLRLDSSGNAVVTGNVTAYGTI